VFYYSYKLYFTQTLSNLRQIISKIDGQEQHPFVSWFRAILCK